MKPSRNRLRHRSLLSRFLLRPGRSWKRCRMKSEATLLRRHRVFSSWKARAASTLPLTCTVRPVDGTRRIGVSLGFARCRKSKALIPGEVQSSMGPASKGLAAETSVMGSGGGTLGKVRVGHPACVPLPTGCLTWVNWTFGARPSRGGAKSNGVVDKALDDGNGAVEAQDVAAGSLALPRCKKAVLVGTPTAHRTRRSMLLYGVSAIPRTEEVSGGSEVVHTRSAVQA